MKRKIMSSILVFLMLSLVVVGCTTSPQAPPTTQLTELKPFTLSVNSWVGFGPFYLAQEKGYFADEGLDVNILLLEGAAERKAAVLSGRVDAMGDTVDLLVLSRDQGVPSVAVAELDISDGADGVVATKDITTIKGLKGKTVAAQRNFVGESFLLYLLKKEGMSVDDVTIVDTESGAAGAAFAAGKVDVAVTWEPWLSQAKTREDGHVLVTSKDEPGVLVDILTVSEEKLKERPEDIKKLLRAWFRAVEYAKEYPQEANAIMAKQYNMDVEEFSAILLDVGWPSYDESLAYVEEGGRIFAVADIFAQVFVETGAISQEPDMTKAVDSSLLEELYQ